MKLEVGKKYVHATWARDDWYECIAIGEEMWLWKNRLGVENYSMVDDEWLLYEEKKKEKWYEVLAYTVNDNTEKQGRFILYYPHSRLKFCENEEILREWNSKEEMINDLKKG